MCKYLCLKGAHDIQLTRETILCSHNSTPIWESTLRSRSRSLRRCLLDDIGLVHGALHNLLLFGREALGQVLI